MASSDVPFRPKSGRRFFLLALFLVLFIGLYTVGWYYVVNRVERAANKALEGLSQNGVAAVCVNMKGRGYPLRFALRCDQLRYDDEPRNLSVATGSFRAKARVWNPFEITGDLSSPVVWDMPGPGGLNMTWDGLRAVVDVAQPLPKSIRLTLTNGKATSTGGGAGALGGVVESETLVQPRGPDLNFQTILKGLSVAPALLDGRTLPLLDGEANITLKDGVLRVAKGMESLRGLSGEIAQLALASGPTAGFSLTGPFSIRDDGRIDADLVLTVRDPPAAAALLSAMFPEARQNIETGFAGMAAMGDKPTLPLRISKGKAMIAFVPLGKIPPVQ